MANDLLDQALPRWELKRQGSGKRMDGQEWTDAIRYRIAYGQAAAWAQAQRFDHGWGREFARSGTPAAELGSEIVRRLGVEQGTMSG
ncbi:MAG TPA: hypothetical protein VKP69_11000 [Isosphaeraceae bacterium]|nr:hypothetical protein [Isosphaeraceae bacterium]